ncbi:thermonuclease family protein [Sphingomonas naasensis]|uniref:Thermonuclease family protein n=1 Tax=Sphingomonas naasensis TaxID=1344951 RepID=A0A4S1W915_9SPHN|nr:thermonuclease family protein [Sphingomonas naasensis]
MTAPLENCRVVDGDTLRCGRERVRLLGIDAAEMPGHCQGNRRCAPGDPFASKRSLTQAAAGRLVIERIGADRYGRTLGLVRGAKGDLSCWQLQRSQAQYRRDWDDGGALAQRCRAAR